MKKTLITLGLASAILVGGCQVSNIPADPNDPNFPVVVDRAKQQVHTDATVAVAVYLGLIDNNEKRAKVGALSYDVASTIHKAVESNELSITDVRKYANDLLQNSGVEDQQRAGLILNAIVAVIQNHVDVKLDLEGDARSKVVRELILGATEGVMEQTSQFQNTPRSALPRPT